MARARLGKRLSQGKEIYLPLGERIPLALRHQGAFFQGEAPQGRRRRQAGAPIPQRSEDSGVPGKRGLSTGRRPVGNPESAPGVGHGQGKRLTQGERGLLPLRERIPLWGGGRGLGA